MNKIKIGNICEILNGFAFKSENYTDSGIRIIRIANVQKGYIDDTAPAFYPQDTKELLNKYMLEEGDLLLSLTGNVGRVAIIGKELLPAALNQRVACLRMKTDIILKDYLFHFLNSDYFENKCIQSSKGVAQKNLSTEWLKNYEIPLYSKSEQKEIIAILNLISSIIVKRKQEIQCFDNLIKARFVELFGDTVVNSKGWPMHRFSQYISFLTSGSRGWAKYFTDEGEYFITIKNVKNCRITIDEVQHINPPDNAEAKRTKVQEGDLLISITADLGRTGVVTKEIANHGAYINQHLTCIRIDRSLLHPLYTAYFMESEAGKKQFQAKNQSAVKAGLNFNSINSLQIAVPPMLLQEKFVSFVAQIDKSKFDNIFY